MKTGTQSKTKTIHTAPMAQNVGRTLIQQAARKEFTIANDFYGSLGHSKASGRRTKPLPVEKVQSGIITLFACILGAPFALVFGNFTLLFGTLPTAVTGATIGFAAGAFLGWVMGKLAVQYIHISPKVMTALGRLMVGASKLRGKTA